MTNDELQRLFLACYRGKTIAILGYRDAAARTRAKFLRDNGIQVRIGLRSDDEDWALAEADGFEVLPVWEAAEWAQIAQSY